MDVKSEITVYLCPCETWSVQWSLAELSTYAVYRMDPRGGGIMVDNKALTEITDQPFIEHALECHIAAEKVAKVLAERAWVQ